MDFVTVSTGLILPYWMGLPIRYIQGYQTYYSGDANVEIYNSKNERLNYYYKAKVYYNIDVNSVIVLEDANDDKVYIFNFDTNQQTQDFYDLLCKKVDKVGVSHTESHSVHH